MDGFSQGPATLSLTEIWLSGLRQSLSRLGIRNATSRLRAVLHFGPWRSRAQALIRCTRPPQQHAVSARSVLPALDTAQAVAALRSKSVFIAGPVDSALLIDLRRVTDHLPRSEYQLVHQIDPYIAALASDPQVLAVLRAYFGCEPVLLESTLMVTGGRGSAQFSPQNHFHFDFAGWHSLNVFLYLTDVEADGAAHEVVEGSHQRMGLRSTLRLPAAIDETQASRFGSVRAITGPAGTLFFENTEALHRRRCDRERRVMLNLLFASHRGFFSKGRASASSLARRAELWQQSRDRGASAGPTNSTATTEYDDG